VPLSKKCQRKYPWIGKLKFLKTNIERVKMGDVHAQGFENLMIDHISSGSWLGTLFIICFAYRHFSQQSYVQGTTSWPGDGLGLRSHNHIVQEISTLNRNRHFSDNEEDVGKQSRHT
jgi:hypothetical protein